MSLNDLDFTKVYLMNVSDSDKSDILKPTSRDLSGSYRVDYDKSENLYIYNEDIGISDWGLEMPYPGTSKYSRIRDIYSACYGTIHDYRYDTTDGSSYMEYVREVRSVTGVTAYYFISHCSGTDYAPPSSISKYLAGWNPLNPYEAEEVDYETLAINFCYVNPNPDIYKLYQLPLFSAEDWGKYLRISNKSGKLIWDPVSSSSGDITWILDRLSAISGIPADRNPVIPAIFPPPNGCYDLFSASLPGNGNSLVSVVSVVDGGRPDPVNSSLFNAGWALSSSGELNCIVFNFSVPVLPDPGSESESSVVRIDIGDCYFKYALQPEHSEDCILDKLEVSEFQSNYIYIPGSKELAWSETKLLYLGIAGRIATRVSRVSNDLIYIPFEVRFSQEDPEDSVSSGKDSEKSSD